MDMTLIDPNLAATPESHSMTTARDLDAAQAEETHRDTLPDIDYVLFIVGSRDDDLRILRRDDPDWRLGRAADSDVPHAIDAVSAAGDFQSVTRFQGRNGFHECRAIRCCVLDDTLGRYSSPCGIVARSMYCRCGLEQRQRGDDNPWNGWHNCR